MLAQLARVAVGDGIAWVGPLRHMRNTGDLSATGLRCFGGAGEFVKQALFVTGRRETLPRRRPPKPGPLIETCIPGETNNGTV